jgi:hydrogenase/urease accessory protein HupE
MIPYVLLGVEHILIGVDHLAFLLALLLLCRRVRSSLTAATERSASYLRHLLFFYQFA